MGLVLTISGPQGFSLRQEIAPGEGASFSVFDAAGELRPAGSYTYELRPVPQIDAATRAQLAAARESGEDAGALLKGAGIPATEVQHGAFAILDGAIVMGGEPEPGAGKPAGGNRLATKDQVIPDDLIVQGSICAGLDCVNNESFGFDTIRMKENNTRIDFTDTSSTSGFPTQDWEIAANDSASGGRNALIVSDENTQLFVIESGNSANAIYIDDTARVGFRTSNPVLDIHISTTNTPGLRLEQTSGGGFTAQTWDIAGNEANFFVRDVTGGSLLPFRIRPGAPTSSIDIAADGDVGIGTASPANKFHIENTSADDEDDFLVTSDGQLTIGSTNAGGLPTMMKLTNPNSGIGSGAVRFVLENALGNQWSFTNDNVGAGELEINYIPNAGTEVVVDGSGNVTATSFNPTSSRALKDRLEPIEPQEVLSRLSELPISTWSFVLDEPGTRHLGPMAEDFKAAFGLGDSDKTINLTDASGVAFAAIQGLHEVVQDKDREIEELRSEVAELRSLVKELGERSGVR